MTAPLPCPKRVLSEWVGQVADAINMVVDRQAPHIAAGQPDAERGMSVGA